jgi:diazepam-binding inhibitor (GABA receptor modulating acyl-CoA-binding protein)
MADEFEKATAYVRGLPKDGPVQLDNATKLEFYAWFKQASEGDVKGTQPWAVQVEARAKWDAWAAVKGMSADEAKEKYVTKLTDAVSKEGVDWRKECGLLSR